MRKPKVIKPSKEELIVEYVDNNRSISEVARLYNTSQPTVRSWLISYEIDRKDQKTASRHANSQRRPDIPSYKEYNIDFHSMSIDQLEAKYRTGQDTLYMWQRMLGIEDKNHSQACIIGKKQQFHDIQFDRETIHKAYADAANIGVMADALNVSYSHARKLCHRHDVEVTSPTRSVGEVNLFEYCKSVAPNDEWIIGDRKTINPFELDILNTTRNIAFEYCGLYWHSETFGKKDRNYHRNKMLNSFDKGVQLYTVFESDSVAKVKSLVDNVLGITQPLNARDYAVVLIETSEARAFYQTHHLAGFIGATTHLGMRDVSGNILMMASFAKARNGIHTYECTRMASHSDVRVRGGASKLFKHFQKLMCVGDTLITYADLRFGTGATYLNCSMHREVDTKPNYWYFHKNSPQFTHSRVAFQKHKLSNMLEKFDSSLSEYQNMLMNGYDRIWDCGNAVYTYEKLIGQ